MSDIKRVLFVDDQTDLLDVIRNMMAQLAGASWEIDCAANAAEGLNIIQQRQIDLVVLDLHMPVIDGAQFVSLLNRKHPNLLKAVLTSDASEEQRALCLSRGAELYLQKPRSAEEWQIVYKSLNEVVRFKPQDGFRGVLRRVGLQDVLQMECLSRHSALLEIATKELRGYIYIREGQIIHAEAGERFGEDAFHYLMRLSGGEFAQKPFVEPARRTISAQWEFLLMESARKRDESGDHTPEITQFATPTPLPTLSRNETQFLPNLAPRPVREIARPQIAEFVVLSSQGDVLYDWSRDPRDQDVSGRVSFLEFVSQKARQIASGLPLGTFESFEIYGSKSRILAQLENDHAFYVKTTLATEQEAA